MSRLEVNGVEVVSRATGERVAAAPDFVIESGRTTCLLGPSGCGKSLTALAILDLLPPELELSQGRFRLDGQDLDAGQRRALRGRRIRAKEDLSNMASYGCKDAALADQV